MRYRSALLSILFLLISLSPALGSSTAPKQEKIPKPIISQKAELIITQPSLTKVVKEKSVELLSSPGLPGRKFYFKVNTPGIKAERVSVEYSGRVIRLKLVEKETWKGEFTLPKNIKPGSHNLTIYVADTDGHLHKGLTNFEVNTLPEPMVKTTVLYIDETNKFEVEVPPGINKATLVLGDNKISLAIRDGIAAASFYLNKETKRKVLYLSDNDGHLFKHDLDLKVEDRFLAGKKGKEALPLDTKDDDSNFLFYTLLGLTILGLAFAFFQGRRS